MPLFCRLEDVCLEEAKFGDFKRARAKGTLTMGTFNSKIATCTSKVSLVKMVT